MSAPNAKPRVIDGKLVRAGRGAPTEPGKAKGAPVGEDSAPPAKATKGAKSAKG